MDTYLFIALIIGAGVFIQSAVGFGYALIAMPMVAEALGLKVAAPLVALIGLTMNVLLVAYYREALNVKAVTRLLVTSLVGIPLGIVGLRYVSETLVLGLLGLLLAGYGVYSLLSLKMPRLDNPRWAYPFGFVAGLLGGAYNTNGPPVIVYGHCRQWDPAQFKSNLQGYFLINNIMILAMHGLNHNLTREVLALAAKLLPFALLGIFLAIRLDRFLKPYFFQKALLLLLIVLGGRLVYMATH